MSEQGKTILVVDDDPDGRALLCKMLQRLGHTPIDFESAQEALDNIHKHTYDIALLDIMMPNMNGYELLEKIRAIPEYKELPVIMVTAKDKDSEILEGYKFGADYYITKPYTSKQLEFGIKIVSESQ
ncbi:MAG: response regulator [Candidatus Dadabacteria bacterium]|nr:MAG: response regulator [Candidatus Dadabacteria bacterium]